MFRFEAKHELGALQILGLEGYLTIELLNDHLADHQSKADSLRIEFGL